MRLARRAGLWRGAHPHGACHACVDRYRRDAKTREEVHHLSWGQVMTEQPPRTAAPDTIKDSITILFPGRTRVV